MSTYKEKIAHIVSQQPDDSTYEEILKEIAFAQMVDKGLKDFEAGNVISNDDMEHRIRSWAQ